MFRLVSAEFRKIFYKPSLFIVTALLIFILAFSSTIYSPLKRDTIPVDISQNSVQKVWAAFDSGSTEDIDSKKAYDNWITSSQSAITYYQSEENTVLVTLMNKLDDLKTKQTTYVSNAQSGSGNTANAKQQYKDSVNSLLNYYESNVKKSSLKYVVAPLTVHNSITNLLGEILTELDKTYNQNEDLNIAASIEGKNCYPKLKEYFGKLVGYYPDKSVVDGLSKYIEETKYQVSPDSRLYKIYQEAQSFVSATPASKNENPKEIKKLLEILSKYKLLCLQVHTIVIDSIDDSALSKFNEMQINSFYGLEKVKTYQIKEELTKTLYLYNNEAYEFEYANVLNMTQTTNGEINAFDYSYYALRLCSFIIIIYLCVLGAGSIASEQANGTLKLLAIRPYKRSKILTSKILSIIFMGGLLILISSAVTLIIGGINYGLSSLPVLMIFNAQKAIVVDVVTEYIIYLLTIMAQIIVFTIISVAISTIFKSSVGSVAISVMIFFASMILNTLSSPILVIVPLCHLDLFKYMGASFLGSSGYSLIDTIFSPVVGTSFNFVLSLVMLVVTTLIIAIITYVVFNKRDIK